jgi:hypothetical protein
VYTEKLVDFLQGACELPCIGSFAHVESGPCALGECRNQGPIWLRPLDDAGVATSKSDCHKAIERCGTNGASTQCQNQQQLGRVECIVFGIC